MNHRLNAAAQDKPSLYVVTLPDGRVVISSKPLLHNDEGVAVNALTIKPIKEFDPASILLFAKFLVLCEPDNDRITFKPSNKQITAYPPWINIFQFLFGREIGNFYSHDSSASQLARFSACVARPSLLLATDEVVHAALCGDEDLAHRMIKANPNYLLQRGNATDFSGRTYTNLTPFQAALITGDDKMAEMTKPYFDRLPNGQAEMQKQVTEIFPQGIEANEKIQKEESETKFAPMLEAVITAIKDAQPADLQAALNNECNNSRLYLVLNKFRSAFTDLSHSEKIFNPHYLLGAFEAYATKFDWNNPNWNKLDLFWRQVIGFVQRFLPANYAQVFAHCLYDIVKNKHLCPRSFNFRDDSDFSFYPLGGAATSMLGFNNAAPDNAGWSVDEGTWLSKGVKRWTFISKLISNKNSKLSELITRRAQSTHSCIIQ